MSLNNKLLQVAIASSCNMLKVGIESLLKNEAIQCHTAPSFTSISEMQQHFSFNIPDVLVITVQLYYSDINGIIDFVNSLKLTWPAVKVIIMLDIHVTCVVQRFLALDIQGLVSLSITVAEWQAFFQRAISGQDCSCAEVGCITWPVNYASCRSELLSTNENRLLGYLLAGHSLSTSAELMSRTKKTVASQKISAMKKLGLTHYSQLVAIRSMLNV